MPMVTIGKTVIKFNFIISGSYAGDVNINDRIIVNGGLVNDLHPNRYQILPYSAAQNEDRNILMLLCMNCNEKTIQAVIDGVKYEGADIIVDGTNVYVNGKLINSNHAMSSSNENHQGNDGTFATSNTFVLFPSNNNTDDRTPSEPSAFDTPRPNL